MEKNNVHHMYTEYSNYKIFMYIPRYLKFILLVVGHSLLITGKNLWFLIFGRTQKKIDGQVVLITGGGGGLAKEIAIELAKHNCNIALADINLKAAEKVALEVEKFDVKVRAYQVDITKQAEIEKLAADIERDLGSVDILINNAALLASDYFLDENSETIQRIINVNLVSYVLTTHLFLPKMISRKKGHIVAISSLAGVTGAPRLTIYCATKFGVTGFMQSLASELECTNHDYIKTTTIFPTIISTREDIMKLVEENDFVHYLPALVPNYVAKQVVKSILEEKIRTFVPSFLKHLLFLQNFQPLETIMFGTRLLFFPLKPIFSR